MTARALAFSTLVLRILTLLLLAASVVVMVLNSYNLAGVKTTWKDVKTYRFVFATAAIGAVYSLIQIPFALYYACIEKRLIRHACLLEFDFYSDKSISYLLVTGVGAGIAVSLELKDAIDGLVAILASILAVVNVDLGFDLNQYQSRAHKFLDRGIIATVLLAGGFVCMLAMSIISSLNRTRSKGFFG